MVNPAFETVAIDHMTLIRSTDKAGLYEDEDDNEYWIPFSMLKGGSVDKDGETGTIRIPRWLAEEKDLEYTEE